MQSERRRRVDAVARGRGASQDASPGGPPRWLVLNGRGVALCIAVLFVAWGVVGGERVVCEGEREAWTCARYADEPILRPFGVRFDEVVGPLGVRGVAVQRVPYRRTTGWAAVLERDGSSFRFGVHPDESAATADRAALLAWVAQPGQPLVLRTPATSSMRWKASALALFVLVGLGATLYEWFRTRRSS